jgi:hypothetical protein
MVSRRLHRIVAAFTLLTLPALAHPAAVSAAGINLSWNDCGAAGTTNMNFACGSNSGSATMVGSFVAPSGITELIGVTATLDMWSSPDSVGTQIPDWWQLGTGGCRSGSISASYDFAAGPYTCIDPWSGQASGGLDYGAQVPFANHATIRLIAAVQGADSLALTADSEYYTFKVTINYSKTVGAGNCSGCSSPVSIALTSTTLSQPAGLGDVILTTAASNNVITWQGGAGLSPNLGSPRLVTFGQIRSLYH